MKGFSNQNAAALVKFEKVKRRFGSIFLAILMIDTSMLGLYVTVSITASIAYLRLEVNVLGTAMGCVHILLSCFLIQLFTKKMLKPAPVRQTVNHQQNQQNQRAQPRIQITSSRSSIYSYWPSTEKYIITEELAQTEMQL